MQNLHIKAFGFFTCIRDSTNCCRNDITLSKFQIVLTKGQVSGRGLSYSADEVGLGTYTYYINCNITSVIAGGLKSFGLSAVMLPVYMVM
jgi:hypothetical protein